MFARPLACLGSRSPLGSKVMCITFNVDGNALVIEMDMNSNDKSVINFALPYIYYYYYITVLLLHYYYMNCKYFLVVTLCILIN